MQASIGAVCMTSPLPFPDWVPPWVHLVALVAMAGLTLLFVLMPFSVFGLKTRLEMIEARLDDIQAELRYIGQSGNAGASVGGPAAYNELPEDAGRVGALRAELSGVKPPKTLPGQPVRAEPRLSRDWLAAPVVARERLNTSRTGLP